MRDVLESYDLSAEHLSGGDLEELVLDLQLAQQSCTHPTNCNYRRYRPQKPIHWISPPPPGGGGNYDGPTDSIPPPAGSGGLPPRGYQVPVRPGPYVPN